MDVNNNTNTDTHTASVSTMSKDHEIDYNSCEGHEPHPFYKYLPPHYAEIAADHTKKFTEEKLKDLWDALESIELEDVLRLQKSTFMQDMDSDEGDSDEIVNEEMADGGDDSNEIPDSDEMNEPWFVMVKF